MAASPPDRYTSARALADDVEQWLADEPVTAYAEPLAVRAWRFARRHRSAFQAAAALLLVITGGSVMAGLARHQQAQEAHRRADHEEQEALEHAQFLQGLFPTADPLGFQSSAFRDEPQDALDMSARRFLDLGTQRLRTQLKDSPLARAALLDTLGNVYRGLGDLDSAEPLVLQGLQLRREHSHKKHVDVADSLHSLGWVRLEQGRWAEAEQLFRQALPILERHPGNDLQAAAVQFKLAWIVSARSLAEAQSLMTEVIRIRRDRLGETHRAVGLALAALGWMQLQHEQRHEAIVTLRRAFAILEDPAATNNCITAWLRAQSEQHAGHGEQATECYETALTEAGTLLSETHPFYIRLLSDYARLLQHLGEETAAESAWQKTLAHTQRSPLRWLPAKRHRGLDALPESQ